MAVKKNCAAALAAISCLGATGVARAGGPFDLESDEAVPYRYHVEKRVRPGLIAGGAAAAAGSYGVYCALISVGSWGGMPAGMYVPVAGPFVLAARAGDARLAAWAVPQLGGLGMIAAGIAFKKRVAVPDRVAVVPVVGPTRDLGVMATGTF